MNHKIRHRPDFFSISTNDILLSVRSHNNMNKMEDVVGKLVKQMDSLKEKWGHPQSFPDSK